jgi:hypothetical protein
LAAALAVRRSEKNDGALKIGIRALRCAPPARAGTISPSPHLALAIPVFRAHGEIHYFALAL